MKKRTVSLLLALCLCLSLLPALPIAAAEDDDFVIWDGVLVSYNGPGGDVVIPDGVRSIGDIAFFGCENLTSVGIPEGVTIIGSSAFFYCENLKSVTFPESLTYIGDGAFSSCHSLESLVIPESVTRIGERAFQGCRSLAEITIPDGVTRIGAYAFAYCFNLAEVTIPDSVRRIDSCAFTDCPITEIRLPEHLDFIGGDAFRFADMEKELWLEYGKVLSNVWENPGAYVSAQSERITSLAREITEGIDGDYEKLKAVALWVSRNIKYDYDYYYERKSTVTTKPEEVLDSRLTICDGYSRLTRALLQAVGIPARYILGPADGLGGWERHAWNEAFVDGRWVLLDTTWMRGTTSYFDSTLESFVNKHHRTTGAGSEEADIPSDWARDEVREAIFDLWFIPADLQSAYRDNITRADFCRLMVSLIEKTSGQDIGAYLAARGIAPGSFTDTDDANVLAANAFGIVSGRGDGIFDPDGAITRQEAARMLANTAGVLGLAAGDAERFSDVADVPDWAAAGIDAVSGLSDPVSGYKVMGGTGGGAFSPLSPYTREQAIMTALRLLHCANI